MCVKFITQLLTAYTKIFISLTLNYSLRLCILLWFYAVVLYSQCLWLMKALIMLTCHTLALITYKGFSYAHMSYSDTHNLWQTSVTTHSFIHTNASYFYKYIEERKMLRIKYYWSRLTVLNKLIEEINW